MCRQFVSRLLCALHLVLISVCLGAGAPKYNVRIWEADDGLPQNYVQAVFQDKVGYLWIGTHDGISRFDGIRFSKNGLLGLSEPTAQGSFLAFAETEDGSVWMGMEGGVLVQVREGVIREFSVSDGLPHSSIRSIEQTRNGTIWFGTNHGLVRRVKDKFEMVTTKDGLANDLVRALCEDRNGRLWIGTDNGLSYFENDRFHHFPLTNGLPRYAIRALCQDHSGALWIGLHGGLIRLQGEKSSLYSRPGGHSENMITSICEDERGTMWIGSYNGLSRFANNVFEPELKGGKSYELVYCVNKDREGNVWVGTRDGLHRLSRRHFTLLTTEDGLPHNNITSIREDRNGEMWVGTWGGGLCKIGNETSGFANSDKQDSSLTVFNSTNGLGSDFVLGLGEDRSGAIWVGTPYDSFGLKKIVNGEFTRFGREHGLTDSGIRVIDQDDHGNIWIGAEHALHRISSNVFTRYTVSDGLTANGIRDIYLGQYANESQTLFGTDAGMTRLQNGTFLDAGYSDLVVNAFFRDRDGDVWIAIWGVGLVRTSNGPIPPIYCEADGLPTSMVHAMLQDNFGGLWISSRNGIHRLDKTEMDDFTNKKRERICSFPLLLGNAEGNSVAKPSAWKRKNGELWFATSKGIAIVKPDEIHLNTNPPPVVIEGLLLDKQVVEHRPGTNIAKRLTIPPGGRDLEIHFTALSYTSPEKNRFKYRLEGVDSGWVDADVRRAAFYNNLAPGDYNFQVIACNNDGVWNETGATLAFALQPFFWQTSWFMFSGITAAVVMIAGSTRYLTRKKMQERLARLEQQHALERERTRIARDMHDDLGANLTEILVLSTLTRNGKNQPEVVDSNASRIAQRAEGVIDSLHAIVWALNPKNDSLHRLANYICEHTQSFLETSSIRCRLETASDLPDYPISSDIRHNVFLAVKEALNNVVKHAEATEVNLHIVWSQNALHIWIRDNGKGFNKLNASGSGNGLQNMEKRIQSIGGTAEVESISLGGTTLHFCIPQQVFPHL